MDPLQFKTDSKYFYNKNRIAIIDNTSNMFSYQETSIESREDGMKNRKKSSIVVNWAETEVYSKVEK